MRALPPVHHGYMAPAVVPQSEVPGDAVSRGYIVAQQWEHSAEISNLQSRAVGLVSACAAERPLPRHVRFNSGQMNVLARAN